MNELLIKVGAVLVLIAGLFFGFEHMKRSYIQQGRDEVTKQYEESSKQLEIKRNEEIAQLKLDHEITNRKVVDDYEDKLKLQASNYDKRIAAIRASGGLRVTKTDSNITTGQTEATSTKTDNGTSDYRLPPRIEDGLFSLARKADEVKEQLNACQSWIREQGFYTDENRTK